MVEKVRGFFAGVRAEYAKIIFPNQETVRRETIAAIVISVVIGLTIFILDTAMKEVLTFIL